MRTRVWTGVLLLAAAGPALSHAFFDGARRGLFSAASAGRGGVEAPAETSLDALLDNPAALSAAQGFQALGLAAMSDGLNQVGEGFAYAPSASLRGGLIDSRFSDTRLSAYHEHSLGAVLSVDVSRGQSLGLRWSGRTLNAENGSSMQGGSLDLGWRWQGRQRGLPGAWTLGLAADHVAGAWPDEDWARSVPSDLRAGLAWRPLSGLWVGTELRWRAEPALADGGGRGLRLGLEWSPLSPGYALRAGWRDELGGEASAGAGLPLPWGLRLDYAALLNTQAQRGLGHRLAVAWAPEQPGEQLASARPSLVLLDPDNDHVERATFKVGLDPKLGARSWRLELHDSQERLRRSLGPFGPLESSVDWDGRDEQGEPVAEGKRVGYTLVVESAKGVLRKSSALDLDQAWDQVPAKRSIGGLRAPRLTPVLGPDGDGLREVAIELPKEDAAGWQLRLRNSGGVMARQFSGLGPPPKELVWDGRGQDGLPVADPLGLSVEFELRGQDGLVRSSEQPLFTQQAFALARQEAKALPHLNLAPLGLPLVSGRAALDPLDQTLAPLLRSAARSQASLAQALQLRQADALQRSYARSLPGGAVELDLFDRGKSEARPDRLSLLDRLPVSKGKQRLHLQGLARADEADAPGLARRRAFGIVQRLRPRLSQGQGFVLSDGPAGGERTGLRAVLKGGAIAPPAWEALSLRERAEALAAAEPAELLARYDISEAGTEPEGAPDRPLPAEQRTRLLQRWGATADGVLTQWNPRTRKALFFKDGCLWATDADGGSLCSIWYDPDLNAAGRLRWSQDGTHIWLRADGWRRWVCLSLEVGASGEQIVAK